MSAVGDMLTWRSSFIMSPFFSPFIHIVFFYNNHSFISLLLCLATCGSQWKIKITVMCNQEPVIHFIPYNGVFLIFLSQLQVWSKLNPEQLLGPSLHFTLSFLFQIRISWTYVTWRNMSENGENRNGNLPSRPQTHRCRRSGKKKKKKPTLLLLRRQCDKSQNLNLLYRWNKFSMSCRI